MMRKLTESERKAQIAIADAYQEFQEVIAKQCENVTCICDICPLSEDCYEMESKTDISVCEIMTKMGGMIE